MKRILVIKLGALGDFVLAFPAFAAIRAHHPEARITLLTTQPFTELARRAPWFDEVRLDARPPWWNLRGLWRLTSSLRGFDFVYDLQTSGRSSRYHTLAGRPPWSGIARGASHPHDNPNRNQMHTRARQRDQLERAWVTRFPEPDLTWLRDPEPALPPEVARDLPDRFALLVPGAAPHRLAKRWPTERFAALAEILQSRGLTPVVVGSTDDAPLAAAIRSACPGAIDLTGRTTLPDLAAIAARASLAIGNDTGPMHLAAAMGAPCLVLFSAESDPALTAPRGPRGQHVTVLRVPDLADLPVERVAAALPAAH
jgi:ADP-heptose:LPS heptosyltransferase